MQERVIHNRLRCKECGDIIESLTVHHYIECSCGKCAADGGKEYIRRVYAYEGAYEELSEVEEWDDELSRKAYEDIMENGKTDIVCPKCNNAPEYKIKNTSLDHKLGCISGGCKCGYIQIGWTSI